MISLTILKNLIKGQKKIIAIYGLGNVGGSITACWLKTGAKVIGVDISKKLEHTMQTAVVYLILNLH